MEKSKRRKDLQVTQAKNPSSNIPWSLETHRALVLKEAGITPKELGRLACKAISKAEEKLEAKETFFTQYKGKIYEIREVEAHQVQLQASKQIMELTGVFPSRFQDGGKTQQAVQINIVVPWAKKETPTLETPPVRGYP